MQVVGVVAAFGLATACTTSDSGGPSNQTMGTVLGAAVGGTVGGLAFGSAGGVIGGALVGALAGNLVGRALDQQERPRLAQATQNAFVCRDQRADDLHGRTHDQVLLVDAAASHGGRRQAGGSGDEPRRRQHLPADRTHGDQERPDDDRDDDFLQGRRFERSEAGFGLIQGKRPAGTSPVGRCSAKRRVAASRVGRGA